MIAHIIPWVKVREHTFDNLIALCPTCHARHNKTDIDTMSLRRYKANLSVLNGRYCDLERRVLHHFAENPSEQEIELPGGFSILLLYLIRDRLLEKRFDGAIRGGFRGSVKIMGMSQIVTYGITHKGREFIEKWISGGELDQISGDQPET